MAQSTLHFAVGMAVASCATLPPLVRAWKAGAPVAAPLRRWLIGSYGLGVFAIVPAILRKLGCPPACWDAGWTNVFLLYPLIERLKQGGTLVGEAAIALIAGAQYLAMLAAIQRARIRPRKDRITPRLPR